MLDTQPKRNELQHIAAGESNRIEPLFFNELNRTEPVKHEPLTNRTDYEPNLYEPELQ